MEIHVLASGSDGNCYVIRSGEHTVMLDQGMTYKHLVEQMNVNGIMPEEIECILVTHEHSDHVKGVGTAARKLKCPVMSTEGTYNGMCQCIGKVDFVPIRREVGFSIGDIDVMPIPTKHDAADPVCYRFTSGGKSAFIATDTGSVSFGIKQTIQDSDLVVLESNYDPQRLRNNPLYPEYLKIRIASEDRGHLSNYQCGDALASVRTGQKIFLGHLSKKNNDPDLAKDTVARTSGMHRARLDCLDCNLDDTRVLRI